MLLYLGSKDDSPIRKKAFGSLCILTISALLTLSCSSRSIKEDAPPVPTNVSSVLLIDDTQRRSAYSEYLDEVEYSRFRAYFQNYSMSDDAADKLVDKSLKRIASEVQDKQTGSALVDSYRRDIEKVKEGYEDVKALASSIGIEQSELLAGAGAAAGAAITTIGGLHLIKPRATLGRVPWTELEAGYDVADINNPKFVLSSGQDVDFIISKDGLSGAMRNQNRLYQVNLDIQKQRATANLSFHQGFSLGSRLSLKDESLTGFINIGL